MSLRLLLFLLSVLALNAASPALEFVGLATERNVQKFALRDPATGASKWITFGGTFGDYTLIAYDTATLTVELTRGSERLRLKLTAASADPTVSTSPTPEQTADIFWKLHKLAIVGLCYTLETGKSSATAVDLVGPNLDIKSFDSVAGEDYTTLVYNRRHPVLTVKTASGTVITYDSRPAGPENESTFYVIKAGDTGAKIARTQAISIPDLLALNDGVDFNKLHAFQLLRIRP